MSSRFFALCLSLLMFLVLLAWSSTLYVMWRLGTRTPPPAATPALPASERQTVAIGAGFARWGPNPPELPGSWPAFMGPRYDGISREAVRLADRWPEAGPPELWSVELGDGYSGAAIHRGRAYVLDYDLKSSREMLRCLSMSDGREIWRRWHDLKLQNNHGYVHTTPALSERYVAIIGAKNHLMCLDPETGDLRWGLDLVRAFGPHLADHYSVQTPLIDGSTIVIAAGGDCLLAGLDGDTGKALWKTPNPRGWGVSLSSVIPALLGGKKQYLYSSQEGIVGVSAEEGSRGQILWEKLTWHNEYNVPVPVLLEDGLIFLTTGYSRGNMLLQISRAGDTPRTLWTQEPSEGLSCEAHTPLYAARHLFGVLSESAGSRKQQLGCMDPHSNGKFKWTSRRRFGMYEPCLLADGKIYVTDKDSYLTMVRASAESYQELGRAKILKGYDLHPWMALAGGRLLIRDARRIACFDLRE